jgi:hypothetical protein
MTDKSISFDLAECIKTLEFIKNIPQKHKPCYNSKTTISKEAWFSTVRRRWGGEKGEYGIIYVDKILDSCNYHYRMCLQSSLSSENKNEYIDTLRRIKDALSGSIVGFENLIRTYSDQGEVSTNYDKCKNRVNDMILDISHDIRQLSVVRDTLVLSEDPEEYDSSATDYTSTGWGYLSDDNDLCDIKKKNMAITSLAPIGVSKIIKQKFFTANNIVLMRTKNNI